MNPSPSLTRRQLVACGAAAGAGAFLSLSAHGQGKAKINMQLGWIAGGNQIGEVVAKRLGYYDTEGIDFSIQPGGPSIDGVAIVASGRYEVGQVSSSPSNMLAVSQDLPIQVFATGLQQHPYTFFSLKKNPIRTPKDMVGKKIGIQSTGMVLLRALLAKNKIDEKSMTIIPIGSDMTPLLTGQVDTVTGWLTNTTALKPLGAERVDMRLWDTGVRLYALPYYATTEMIRTKPELLQRFLRATARGWAYANKNRDAAVELLMGRKLERWAQRVEAAGRVLLGTAVGLLLASSGRAEGGSAFVVSAFGLIVLATVAWRRGLPPFLRLWLLVGMGTLLGRWLG